MVIPMNSSAYLEMRALEEKHWWYLGRREIIISYISDLNLPAEASILEVGCGTGGNLKMLSQFGSVVAIEMNDAAIKYASSSNSGYAKIYPGWLPDNIKNINGKFDLICLFDVLEHISKDAEALSILNKFLSPKGVIIITVPAYQWLWSMHDIQHQHHRRYTMKSLELIATNENLVMNKSSYFNMLLFPIAAAVRLTSILLRQKSYKISKMPNIIINSILFNIFKFESTLIKSHKLPAGLSIIAAFTKNNITK